MQKSKAGKRLNPIIAKETFPIFQRDPVRYKRLCGWVWWAQKHSWEDETIANALRMATWQIDKADNWWKYLTALLPKAKAKAVEQESESYKKGNLNSFGSILKEIVAGLK